MSIELYKPYQKIPYTAKQLNALCEPEKGIEPGDFLEKEWLDMRYAFFYVKDGVPVGVAFCVNNSSYLSLQALCVSQTERKSGIGSILLKEVDDFARSLGANIIRILAVENQVSFYKKNGFVEDGSEEGGYIPMKKTLAGGRRRKKTRRNRRHTRRY